MLQQLNLMAFEGHSTKLLNLTFRYEVGSYLKVFARVSS